MSYPKNSTSHYFNNQGINQKVSEYSTNNAQVLDLRNLDFFVPNAWQKTPGSTQGIFAGTSGPVKSLYEFERLSGESYLMASTDTAVFYKSVGNTLTVLSTSFTSGQPVDFLTFLNKCWMSNGQKMVSWDGTNQYAWGLPMQGKTLASTAGAGSVTVGNYAVLGVTVSAYTNATTGQRAALLAAFAYVRTDGYMSPIDMYNSTSRVTPLNYEKQGILGASYLVWEAHSTTANYGANVNIIVSGFTTNGAQGVSGYAVFLAMDIWTGITATMLDTYVEYGNSGLATDGRLFIPTTGIKQTSDLSNFYYYTTIAAGTATLVIGSILTPWPAFKNSLNSFSLMTFNFFASNTPRYIEINNNRLFASGFSNTPSYTWFSELAEPEVFDADWFFETRTNDGDRITGIKSYQNQLVVFKQRSFAKLIGDNPDNYQLVELSTEYGCLSNKAIVEYNDILLFLDEKGIVRFDGASWSIISTPVEDTMRTMNITAAIENAVGIHFQERNQVWFGIPVNGATENNLTVVYDYLINAWTFIEGFHPASFTRAKQYLNQKTAWFGDYSGIIHYMSPSFYSYNGTAFTCAVTTAFDAPDGKDVENMFRRLFLDVNVVSGVTGVINVQVLSNYSTSVAQTTFAIYQNQFQTRADFGVPGKAVGFKMHHSNPSLPLLINGYDVQRRFLRKV